VLLGYFIETREMEKLNGFIKVPFIIIIICTLLTLLSIFFVFPKEYDKNGKSINNVEGVLGGMGYNSDSQTVCRQ
jgi:hypothetical protein